MNLDKRTQRGLDFTPALFAVLFAFVAMASVQFVGGWPAAERGLLLFEKTCPIYATHANHSVNE